MSVSLYEHQRKAVEELKNGSILCGGVGTGKSLTSLSYYFDKECFCMQLPKDLYIITTARKRDTGEWEKECQHFGLSSDNDICKYDVKVVVDSWNNIKKYSDIENSFFIFDEQRVVGWGAWTKSFLKITKNNRWILLSATPGDTWSDYIPVFVANGFYRTKTEFTRRHVVYKPYIKNYPVIDRYVETKTLMEYRSRILVLMDFDTPAKSNHIHISVDYDKNEYKHIWRDRWNVVENEPVSTASELCYQLRRSVNSNISRITATKKIMYKHDKLIVFYNFDYELEALKTIEMDGFTISEWNGHKHEPIPNTDKWLYLVQYTAGAEGWNCIETNALLFFSQNYSYKVMIQAAGRIDRMNTKFEDLYYYHLKSTAPIDLAIARALNSKKQFNESKYIREGK